MPSRIVAVGALAVLTAVLLAGCVDAPAPEPTSEPTGPTTEAPVAPAEPELDLEGSATNNRGYFDLVNNRLIASGAGLDGRGFIDNLVAAGFPKTDLEVTPDRTAINLAADNVQFAVRINGECLIGQYGNVGYASTVAPLLSTGRCLVGQTRPIDW